MESKRLRKKAFKHRIDQSEEFNPLSHHSTDVASVINRVMDTPSNVSHSDILNLQGGIGNKATMQLMAQSGQSSGTIQRILQPIEGTSSGWFKGRRDKLNLMVAEYNIKKGRMNKELSSDDKKELKQTLRSIRMFAQDWRDSVEKSNPDKAKEINDWIKTVLEVETKVVGGDGMDKWLIDPKLSKQFLEYCKQEFNSENIEAYLAILDYEKNPNREKAIKLYLTYIKQDSEKELNIQRSEPIIKELEAVSRNKKAPLPTNFESVKKTLAINLADPFSRFMFTDTYVKETVTNN